MGGATQSPEIRTQSLNGVFRWWFRVAGGSWEDEKRIFGSAGDTTGRRGLVDLILEKNNNYKGSVIAVNDDFKFEASKIKGSGSRYLAFALRMGGGRTGIKEGFEFRLKVSFHPLAREDDKKKFLAAMWLAFNLGNFGARARRGFGSIGVEKVEGNPNTFGLRFVPNMDGRLDEWLKRNLEEIRRIFGSQKTYQKIKVFMLSSGNMNHIGKTYQVFRQCLRIEDRIFFGLPLGKIAPKIHINDRWEKTRRASPMIFKILRVGDRHMGLVTVMVYEFLPLNAKIINLPKRVNINEYRKIVDLQKVIPHFEIGLNLRRIYP